ncbi:MAG: tyrosine-protein phosphatase [Isosphaeraceae bacterium]|nr:tyrosine-protein phosphatase [Isosphaeraceae bacterium]
MRRAHVRKWVLGTVLALLTPPLGFVTWNLATDNFATVESGTLYRSGQMDPAGLGRAIRAHAIKTVLNLRGSHSEQVWYRGEQKATLDAGATQVDMALSSCEWMSRAQLRTLVRVLDTSERPLLIHCWRGSERTGLATALARLLEPGSTLEDARAAFSLRYLYARMGDGKVMAEHLDQYEAWLRKQALNHAPEHLRRWAEEGFQPGTPCREQWPYDPFPLVVITRPEPKTNQVAETTEPVRK